MNLYLTMLKTLEEGDAPTSFAAGFPHFGPDHLYWLLVLGTAALLTAFLHEKASERGRKMLRKGIVLFCFLLHLLSQGTVTGSMTCPFIYAL